MLKFLQDILDKVIGLECIVIADREGAPLIEVNDRKVPDTALTSCLLSTFGLASSHGAKLGMGEATTTICMYGSHQVVQMDKDGFNLTFIGSTDCNTGHILAISNELSPLLADLKKITGIDVAH